MNKTEMICINSEGNNYVKLHEFYEIFLLFNFDGSVNTFCKVYKYNKLLAFTELNRFMILEDYKKELIKKRYEQNRKN